jgi:lysophospholipase L1-like esterase
MLGKQWQHKIVGLGDSTTAGTPGFRSPLEAPPIGEGNPESQYAYWIMRVHPEWQVLNRGINGQRSDQILGRFGRDVTREKPEAVIILAGVNDIFQGRSSQSVLQNLQSMYRVAVREKIVTVACTILPYNSSEHGEILAMREINSWLRERSREGALTLCDTSSAVSDPSIPYRLASTPDGLHPDVAGYRKMGEELVNVLERVLN